LDKKDSLKSEMKQTHVFQFRVQVKKLTPFHSVIEISKNDTDKIIVRLKV